MFAGLPPRSNDLVAKLMVRVTSLALIFGHNICAHIMLLFELVWKYGTPQFQGEYRWKSPFWVYWYFQRKTKKQNKPTKYPQNLDNILEMYKCFGNTSFSNKPTKYVQHCSTGRLSPAQQNHQLGSLKKKNSHWCIVSLVVKKCYPSGQPTLILFGNLTQRLNIVSSIFHRHIGFAVVKSTPTGFLSAMEICNKIYHSNHLIVNNDHQLA